MDTRYGVHGQRLVRTPQWDTIDSNTNERVESYSALPPVADRRGSSTNYLSRKSRTHPALQPDHYKPYGPVNRDYLQHNDLRGPDRRIHQHAGSIAPSDRGDPYAFLGQLRGERNLAPIRLKADDLNPNSVLGDRMYGDLTFPSEKIDGGLNPKYYGMEPSRAPVTGIDLGTHEHIGNAVHSHAEPRLDGSVEKKPNTGTVYSDHLHRHNLSTTLHPRNVNGKVAITRDAFLHRVPNNVARGNVIPGRFSGSKIPVPRRLAALKNVDIRGQTFAGLRAVGMRDAKTVDRRGPVVPNRLLMNHYSTVSGNRSMEGKYAAKDKRNADVAGSLKRVSGQPFTAARMADAKVYKKRPRFIASSANLGMAQLGPLQKGGSVEGKVEHRPRVGKGAIPVIMGPHSVSSFLNAPRMNMKVTDSIRVERREQMGPVTPTNLMFSGGLFNEPHWTGGVVEAKPRAQNDAAVNSIRPTISPLHHALRSENVPTTFESKYD